MSWVVGALAFATRCNCPYVMGDPLWEYVTSFDPDVGPLTYNSTVPYYYASNDNTQSLMWWEAFDSDQSIEITATNFGMVDNFDMLAIECRRTDLSVSGAGLRAVLQKTSHVGGLTTGDDWYYYIEQYEGASSYFYDPPGSIGNWPYGDTFTFRLDSDDTGDFRVYINGAVLLADTITSMPTGPSKVGLWVDTALSAGGVVTPVEATTTHITNICFCGTP